MQRREWLTAAALAPLLAVEAQAAADSKPGESRPVPTAPRLDAPRKERAQLTPVQLLESYVRLRGSTDGSVTAGWLDSLRYAVIDGEAHLLCRVLAGALVRFERRSEALYEATILEITHYVDPESGTLLETLVMPVSGRSVKVPPYRIGPSAVRFAVALDEREEFRPQQAGSGAANFAPLGEVRLQRSISDPRLGGTELYVRHEEIGSLTPHSSAVQPVSYREWTIWHGPAATALDARASYCPCEYSYTAMTSWRPWMQMDGMRGHTLDNGRGAKVRRFADLPQDYLALTERVHPDVMRDPEAALRRTG